MNYLRQFVVFTPQKYSKIPTCANIPGKKCLFSIFFAYNEHIFRIYYIKKQLFAMLFAYVAKKLYLCSQVKNTLVRSQETPRERHTEDR